MGASASSLGWTVTVEGVVSDRWYAYILCTLSRDDGGVIEPGEYGFHHWDFGLPEGEGYGWSGGIQWLTDGDLGDNKVPFLFHISSRNTWDMGGAHIRMTLEGLSTSSYAESWALLVGGGGRWELEFDLPAGDRTRDFTPGLEVQVGGAPATLELVRCAPLELWVEFTSEAGAFQTFNSTLDPFDAEYPVFLLADGSTLKLGGGGGTGDGSRWYSAYTPREGTIDPAQIVGLQIGDAVYPLALGE